jgi:hypothetical protein
LNTETQQKIVDTVFRVFKEISHALQWEDMTYEELVQYVKPWLDKYGNQSLSAVLLEMTKYGLPDHGKDVTLAPEDFITCLELVDTRQKAEALLLAMPEPDEQKLNVTLAFVQTLLPTVRPILQSFSNRLPHAPGGRPKVLVDPAKRQAIRERIGRSLADGVTLRDAQLLAANDEGVGLSTIQTIWRERKTKRKE